MLLFNQVSVPMMMLGSAESKRLHMSSFLFLQLWKLMFKIFRLRNEGVCFVLRDDIGEELDRGGPGLEELVALDESSTLKELLDESTTKDSNRLVEKLGIPQLTQCHDILVSVS